MGRRRPRRNDDDLTMKTWRPVAFVLGILITLGAAYAALKPAFDVPIQQQRMAQELKEWNLATHEPRIKALEDSNRELRDGLKEVSKDVQALDKTVSVGIKEIQTLIGGMVTGVNEARSAATRAENTVEDYQVQTDDVVKRLEAEQRKLHGIPEPAQPRGKP